MALNYSSEAYGLSEGQPPRKKVRKGTHSCLECRRRKVRCTFPSGNQSVCAECAVRRCACISQEYEEVYISRELPRKNIRDRIGRLEAMVEQLQYVVESQNPNVDENQRSAAQVLENMSVGLLSPVTTPPDSTIEVAGSIEHAPVISLFDNAILSRKDDDAYHSASESHMPRESESVDDNVTGDRPTITGNLCQVLIRNLPPPEAMESIFSIGGSWWALWRQLCPIVSDDGHHTSLQELAAYAIHKKQPVLLAYVLLSVAISVQELPSDYDYGSLNLPVPPENILQHCVSTVQRLVTWDDELVGNVAGLDCLLIQGKCHINLGQPRKAWLLVRRAASLAQHLGLHRVSTRSRGEPASASMRQGRRIWWTIYEYDRYMSQLLGLPYSVSDSHIDLSDKEEEVRDDVEASHWRSLAIICGHLVDLTQAPIPQTFAATYDVDRKLEELAKSMSDDWWELGSGKNIGLHIFFKRLMSQLGHHYIRAMLHIPFMLRSVTDERYEQSRLICLSSAREVIKLYRLLRDDIDAGSYVCRVVDFQAFTATMMLLLNLLGHNKSSPAAGDPRQAESDWAVVDSMIDLMRLSSKQPCNTVAVQALKVLETLKVGKDRGADIWDGRSVTLVIPYFGAITIAPGSQLRPVVGKEGFLPREQQQQQQQQPQHVITENSLQQHMETTTQPIPPHSCSPPGYNNNNNNNNINDEPLISFSSLLGPAFSPSQMPWPSQEHADALLRDPTSLDLDHEWNWIWKD